MKVILISSVVDADDTDCSKMKPVMQQILRCYGHLIYKNTRQTV